MIHTTIAALLRRVALALTLAAGSGLAIAGTIHVTVDTASFGASSGYLDMQLSASGGVPLATALVSNMVGFDPSAYIDSWGVTPSGGGYLFRNDTSNDLFHAVAFGGVLSFDLTFAGVADPRTSYVSHLIVSAFDEAFSPLGNYDPVRGSLADFSWTPALTAGAEGRIGVSLSDPAAVTAVPEPAVTMVPEPDGWMLAAAGLAALALSSRRRRQ
jgi:MYXO-CTERM domain-containing protein